MIGANPGRTPQMRGRKVLTAPPALDIIDPQHMADTLDFIAKLRRMAVLGSRPIYLDLASCKTIGALGCMLLAAEIEHCRSLKPNCIIGRDPVDPRAKATLEFFGFHQLLGFRQPDGDTHHQVVKMQSGHGADPKLAKQLGDVAALAYRVWEDQAFADRVHAALNEAVTNVIMHAYPDDGSQAKQWWIAGFADVERKIAFFFAMDHGVGIPKTAIQTMPELMTPYKAQYPTLPDEIVLLATIKGGRSQTSLPQHGKGLGAMIGLVENRSRGGGVWIYSGGAQYSFALGRTHVLRDGGVVELYLKEPAEAALKLPKYFGGTLVVWRVDGPADPDGA